MNNPEDFDDDEPYDPSDYCPDCGCDLETENHDWDCWADDGDEDDGEFDDEA